MSDKTKFEQTIGAILAGGTAIRLGQVLKSNIKVNGISLLDRVKGAVEKSCSTMVLSIGTHSPDDFNNPDVLDLIPDSGQGPAIALAKISQHVQKYHREAEFLLLVAVDTPFFPSDFVERAHKILQSDVDAVVAAFDDQIYPTNALWRLSSLTGLAKQAEDGNAPRALFGILDQLKWQTLNYLPETRQNPFTNINTPSDLIACNRRAEIHDKQDGPFPH